MSFTRVVAPVRECPGVELTAIAARDGIAVDFWGSGEFDAEEIIAEVANFMREVVVANRELQLGTLEQIAVHAQGRTALISLITEEYFLLTLINAQGLLGKARFKSRVAACHLRGELA